MKLVGENIGGNFISVYFKLGSSFLDMILRVQKRNESLYKLDINLSLGDLVIEELIQLKMSKYLVHVFHKKENKSQISM